MKMNATVQTNMTGNNVCVPGSITEVDMADGAITNDKKKESYSYQTLVFTRDDINVNNGIFGFKAYTNMRLHEVTIYLQNTGTAGVTETTINLNGNPIFATPPAIKFDATSNFTTVDLRTSPVTIPSNSEITLDLGLVATDAAGLTIQLTMSTQHIA